MEQESRAQAIAAPDGEKSKLWYRSCRGGEGWQGWQKLLKTSLQIWPNCDRDYFEGPGQTIWRRCEVWSLQTEFKKAGPFQRFYQLPLISWHGGSVARVSSGNQISAESGAPPPPTASKPEKIIFYHLCFGMSFTSRSVDVLPQKCQTTGGSQRLQQKCDKQQHTEWAIWVVEVRSTFHLYACMQDNKHQPSSLVRPWHFQILTPLPLNILSYGQKRTNGVKNMFAESIRIGGTPRHLWNCVKGCL